MQLKVKMSFLLGYIRHYKIDLEQNDPDKFFSYNTTIILPSKAKKKKKKKLLMRGFFIFSLKEKTIYMHGWLLRPFIFKIVTCNSKKSKTICEFVFFFSIVSVFFFGFC